MLEGWDVYYRVKGNPLKVGVFGVLATCEWQAQSKFREQMMALAGQEHADQAKAIQVEKVALAS
jgi:hypothetical protein